MESNKHTADIQAGKESCREDKIKSISDMYPELSEDNLLMPMRPRFRFFEKLCLSNHLSAVYGVFGSSSNG